VNQLVQHNIKDFLTKNYFAYLFYAFLLVGIFPLLLLTKYHINVFINEHIANYTLDPFFILYSQIFEGWAIIFVVIALAFFSKRKMAYFTISAALAGIFIYVLKDFVFGNVPRPTKLLPIETISHILEDKTVYKENYSFPSGHTTFAFAVMSICSLLTKKQWCCVVFFLVAIGAAFSRLYLLQHYFVDIYCGAILGFSIALFTFYLCGSILQIQDEPLFKRKRG